MVKRLSLTEMCEIGMKVKNWEYLENAGVWNYRGSIENMNIILGVENAFSGDPKKARIMVVYNKAVLGSKIVATKKPAILELAKYVKNNCDKPD